MWIPSAFGGAAPQLERPDPDDFEPDGRAVRRRGAGHPEFEMELQFVCRKRGRVYTGSGRTKILSAEEVTFETDREFPAGSDIEMRIRWPFLLQSVCPLELFVTGKVTSFDPWSTVVQIDRYEFRTCGEHSFEPAIAKGTTCDLVA